LAFLTGSIRADDLLYASDGKQLFSVDLQNGALTFQSDGPLQWIASPAFDEEHHTRFWFPDQAPLNNPFPYTRGNPFTGDTGLGAATMSMFAYPGGPFQASNLYGYAPTTQRLYTVTGDNPGFRAIMVDQFNGPVVANWGIPALDLPGNNWWEYATAIGFDPTTNSMMFSVTGGNGYSSSGNDVNWVHYGVVLFDPAESATLRQVISFAEDRRTDDLAPPPPVRLIQALAVEPNSGDIYYVRNEDANAVPSMTLRRWDRALSQDFEICALDAPLQLRFAGARYIQP